MESPDYNSFVHSPTRDRHVAEYDEIKPEYNEDV